MIIRRKSVISLKKQNAVKFIAALLLCVWLGLLLSQPTPFQLIKEFGLFSGLGVIGASAEGEGYLGNVTVYTMTESGLTLQATVKGYQVLG